MKEIEHHIFELNGGKNSKKSEEKKREDGAHWMRQLKETLAHRQLITVFDFRKETGEALDSAILNALFKARALEQRAEESGKGELQLALAWDRFDMAQSTIFNTERSGNVKIDKRMFTELMPFALINDRVEFVHEFLERGFLIPDFLTIAKLLHLYQTLHHNTALFRLLKSVQNKTQKIRKNERPRNKGYIDLFDVGYVIDHVLIRDLMGHHFLSDPHYNNLDLETLIETDETEEPDPGLKKRAKKTHEFEDANFELFVWAILQNRYEMARLFWQQTNVRNLSLLYNF